MARSQFGSISRLDKDRYRIYMTDGYDKDGKQKRRSKVVRGTRDDAEIELAKMKLGMGLPADISMTVDKYWRTMYSETTKARVSENTWITYTNTYGNHIKPVFGNMDMDSVNHRIIEAKLNAIEAPYARLQAFKVLRQIFTEAFRDDIIAANPFHKKIRIIRPHRTDPDTLSLNELIKWTQAIKGFRFEAAMLLCAYGGLRREEACALEWEDIQFERIDEANYAFINISKAYPRTGITSTKTERSNRTVVIADPTSSRLLEIAEHGALCKRETGEMIHPSRVSLEYKKWRDTTDVKSVTIQRLRTTYATLQQQIGTDATITSRALGHTKLDIDFIHYFATNSTAYIAAANALGDAIKDELSTF